MAPGKSAYTSESQGTQDNNILIKKIPILSYNHGQRAPHLCQHNITVIEFPDESVTVRQFVDEFLKRHDQSMFFLKNDIVKNM